MRLFLLLFACTVAYKKPSRRQNFNRTQSQNVRPNTDANHLPYGLVCRNPIQFSSLSQKSTRIVGGSRAKFNWPFIVRIQISEYSFCGGTLLNNRWVVTAAHCVAKQQQEGLSVTLTFGDQVISNSSESGEIEQVADQFFIHAGYNSKKALNDIALIRLYEPVHLGPTINPACLATDDDVLYEGRTCFIAGWGAEDERYSNGFVSDHLLEAPVPIIPDSTCMHTKSYGRIFRPENHLCAGYMSGGQNDACQNDSGGPLICIDAQNQPILTGITSFGIGCARKNFPGVYTRITSYREWIFSTIEEAENSVRAEQFREVKMESVVEAPSSDDCSSTFTKRSMDPQQSERTLVTVRDGALTCYGVVVYEKYVLDWW